MTAGLAESLVDLFLRGTLEIDAIKDVFSDGSREKYGFLLDKSNLCLMVPCVVQVLQVFS